VCVLPCLPLPNKSRERARRGPRFGRLNHMLTEVVPAVRSAPFVASRPRSSPGGTPYRRACCAYTTRTPLPTSAPTAPPLSFCVVIGMAETAVKRFLLRAELRRARMLYPAGTPAPPVAAATAIAAAAAPAAASPSPSVPSAPVPSDLATRTAPEPSTIKPPSPRPVTQPPLSQIAVARAPSPAILAPAATGAAISPPYSAASPAATTASPAPLQPLPQPNAGQASATRAPSALSATDVPVASGGGGGGKMPFPTHNRARRHRTRVSAPPTDGSDDEESSSEARESGGVGDDGGADSTSSSDDGASLSSEGEDGNSVAAPADGGHVGGHAQPGEPRGTTREASNAAAADGFVSESDSRGVSNSGGGSSVVAMPPAGATRL